MTVFCAPLGDGNEGSPLGIEVDQNNIMYVTDQRLGLLKVKPNGSYKQASHFQATKVFSGLVPI